MQHFLDGYEGKFKKKLEERREKVALPIRPRGKKTRLWIDNEYFSERYGEVLPLSALAVYAVLAKFANARTQSCYPSVTKIMQESCIKSAKTVAAALKQLEQYRLIKISHSRGRSSNRYTLLDSRIWLKPNPVKISAELGQILPSTPVKNDLQSHISEIREKEIMEDNKRISLNEDSEGIANSEWTPL
jgi:hypothetical protein